MLPERSLPPGPDMDPDAIALFRELADRSPSEREEYYAEHLVPAALRAEVESLLRFDGETVESIQDRVAAAAAQILRDDAPNLRRHRATPTDETGPPTNPTMPSEIGEGRFPAGTLVDGRHRIISLLGRGGMGEVYRASDLKLKQPVALKFLPDAAAQNPRLRARLHREVRLARQISHPNVCRVYDIGEVDGAAFISMQYIDGEDLASLLRRIGHLPHDKALEIARRLCAGLAAAHDKAVVHRDLKPANIMIDGRGQVFITDFGLASTARELARADVRSGTPAYMAPEQLQGREVSIGSDLYALGLVLYEMFTGKRAFDQSRQPADKPPSLSRVAKNLDPAVARAIERCLEVDPRDRPESALAVAASLPGGDPLAEALAAGVTPSPHMVAASENSDVITVRWTIVILAFVFAGLAAAVVLGGRASVLRLTPSENPPEVLSQKAREMIKAFGYTATPVDRAFGFFWTDNYQRYAEQSEPTSEYRAQLTRGQPPLISFWYRESPQYLLPRNANSVVFLNDDPALAYPGEVFIWIDRQGRLWSFEAVPPAEDYSSESNRPGDWDALFAAAGADRSRFTRVEPQWIPRVTFDDRAAWTGTLAHAPSVPMRIEAASWKGRLVYFRMIGPWTVFQVRSALLTEAQTAGLWVSLGLGGIVIAAAGFVAWRNLRAGRGDPRSASRLAAVTMVCSILSWLMTAHHVPTLAYSRSAFVAFALPVYYAGIVWVLYMAIEPYVRRRWPQSLITWTRVLSGRARDPLVGTHVLFGTACGIAIAIGLSVKASMLLGEGFVPVDLAYRLLQGAGWALRSWLGSLLSSVVGALGLLVLFLIARITLRRDWMASVAVVIMFSAVAILQSPRPLMEAVFAVPSIALYLWILIRLGVLPMVITDFVASVLTTFPLTTDLSAWYSGATLFALATVLVLAIWSFRVALAGRPVLRDEFLEASG